MMLSVAEIKNIWNGWIESSFNPWVGAKFSSEEISDRLDLDYNSDGAFCFFKIDNGSVEVDPCTARDRPYMVDVSHPMGLRVNFFLALLKDAVRNFGVSGSARICLFVADEYVSDLRGPVFFFQKPKGGRALLLPDIDLIILGYCADSDGRFGDSVAWEDKRSHAIFVGSTTGNVPLTAQHVHQRSNARIRAAMFFRGHDNVAFELPNICQVDSEETKNLIESLDIAGPGRDWIEQQKSRYQISIDGNGATCARVSISLHSKSVLMMYDSNNHLYYFDGLIPWTHYIPIVEDLNILRVLEDSDRFEEVHSEIAKRSRVFAQQILTRHAILSYTARLLQNYINEFGSDGGVVANDHSDPFVDSRVHLQGVGDYYADFGAWNGLEGRPIEGFTLIPANGLISEHVGYAAIAEDGRVFHVDGDGLYCGTRGQSLALRGMTAQLQNGADEKYQMTIMERFADGHERTNRGGEMLIAHTAPLISFRIDIKPIEKEKLKPWWNFLS